MSCYENERSSERNILGHGVTTLLDGRLEKYNNTNKMKYNEIYK